VIAPMTIHIPTHMGTSTRYGERRRDRHFSARG